MTKGRFRPLLFVVIVWMHLMALTAVWYGFTYGFTLGQWGLFIGLYTMRAIGISLGNHRLFVHRSFRCHFCIEVVLNFCAGLAAQGHMTKWVLDHDQHHLATEEEWDPHSPLAYPGLKGFFWAHMGWLFFEVNRPSESLVLTSARKNARIAKWDTWLYPFAVVTGFAVPYYYTGVGGLLLCGFAGVVVSWHVTWSVNSVCHLFGSREHVTARRKWENSRNNWPLAILSYIGEAWHHNHHAKADCAYLGWKWYHPDLGKWLLMAGEPLGLVWDVKKPPQIL